MDTDSPLSAYKVVNEYSEYDLRKIIYDYGEERFAPKIAKAIIDARLNKPIETTVELSDIISFHSYQSYEKLVAEIRFLQRFNRPLFLTEWLHRINHNNVQEIYPLLYLANVSNYCWGFVVGKTQTHEPWTSLWEQWDQGVGARYDFTKWQHDLFRPNLRPYDPNEIVLIEKFNQLAAEEGR